MYPTHFSLCNIIYKKYKKGGLRPPTETAEGGRVVRLYKGILLKTNNIIYDKLSFIDLTQTKNIIYKKFSFIDLTQTKKYYL